MAHAAGKQGFPFFLLLLPAELRWGLWRGPADLELNFSERRNEVAPRWADDKGLEAGASTGAKQTGALILLLGLCFCSLGCPGADLALADGGLGGVAQGPEEGDCLLGSRPKLTRVQSL